MKTKSYYALPFVCCSCRKSFKIRSRETVSFFQTHKEAEMPNLPCPQCQQQLRFVGRYFKAPQKGNVKQWRKVEELYRIGWRADGRSSSPQKLRDARSYFANKVSRDRASQTQRKQEAQNEKWRAIRKLKQHLVRHTSSVQDS